VLNLAVQELTAGIYTVKARLQLRAPQRSCQSSSGWSPAYHRRGPVKSQASPRGIYGGQSGKGDQIFASSYPVTNTPHSLFKTKKMTASFINTK